MHRNAGQSNCPAFRSSLSRWNWCAYRATRGNEHIIGEEWPLKTARNERLKHNVELIRALLAGETVTDDRFVTFHKTKIWSLPETMPTLIGGALSVETARNIGTWADGMITVNAAKEHVTAMIEAFREVGGEQAPVYIQSHVSYADTDEQARANAFRQWRLNVLAGDLDAE